MATDCQHHFMLVEEQVEEDPFGNHYQLLVYTCVDCGFVDIDPVCHEDTLDEVDTYDEWLEIHPN